MKKWVVFILFIIYFTDAASQQIFKNNSYQYKKTAFKDTSAILLLNNALVPNAVIAEKKNIICTATQWTTLYPTVICKIDSNNKLIWNNIQLSTPSNNFDGDGDALILPSNNGGAFIAFDYKEFRSMQNGTEYYASYPCIQNIDASGSVIWSSTGKRLTNMTVDFQGGATIRLICYAPDGDIMIYWTWFNDHHTTGVKNEFGTYVQKLNPNNGELKYGATGKKLFNFMATNFTEGQNGNIYVAQDPYVYQNGGDSLACLNSLAEKKWQLPLLEGIDDCFIGTNDFGEMILIYGTIQDLRANLYDSNGAVIWQNKILSTVYNRVIPTMIRNWGKDKWIFKMGDVGNNVFCIDRNGIMNWGETGVKFSDGIFSAEPLNNEYVLVAYRKQPIYGNFTYDLYVQKLNIMGETMWANEGFKIFNEVSAFCSIIPDQKGGASLIFDAVSTDTPVYRPRGTYFQKIDKNGNQGIVTSIKEYKSENFDSGLPTLACYPNPFNSSTIINYTIPVKTNQSLVPITLKIFDVLGKEITVLVNENKMAGTYNIYFNASALTSGIYFYQLNTNSYIITKKMIVLR